VGWATDLNRMARSHRWNNLEDVRLIKSTLGDVLVAGGIAVAASGADDKDDDDRASAIIAGAAIAGLGELLQAGSAADVRHAEFFPQRIFVVPVQLGQGVSSVTLQVENDARSKVVLSGLTPPQGDRLQLRYVRVPVWGDAWQRAGEMVYANDFWSQRVAGDELPYIFGGACVSRPSGAVLQRYQSAGQLTGLTLTDLENLYRAEGITWTVEDQQGRMLRHVLDGGTSLVPALPGTLGYQRLFGQRHQAYEPRSEELKAALASEQSRQMDAKTDNTLSGP
jgi:hypothetical protein